MPLFDTGDDTYFDIVGNSVRLNHRLERIINSIEFDPNKFILMTKALFSSIKSDIEYIYNSSDLLLTPKLLKVQMLSTNGSRVNLD